MGLDPNIPEQRDVAIRRLLELRKAYAKPVRNHAKQGYYTMCVQALECALLALGVPATEWDKL